MTRIFACLALVLLVTGCTLREVQYQGVTYKHRSFLNQTALGRLDVTVSSNGIANVRLENYANDQVSAVREAKELLTEVNKLKGL